MTSPTNVKPRAKRIRDGMIVGAATIFAAVFAAISGTSNPEQSEEEYSLVVDPQPTTTQRNPEHQKKTEQARPPEPSRSQTTAVIPDSITTTTATLGSKTTTAATLDSKTATAVIPDPKTTTPQYVVVPFPVVRTRAS